MKKRRVAFLLGVPLLALVMMFVAISPMLSAPSMYYLLTERTGSMVSIIQGPFDYVPPSKKVIRELPTQLIEKIGSQVGITLVAHAFTIEVQDGEFCSVFEVEGRPALRALPKLIFVVWSLASSGDPKVREHGPIKLEIAKAEEREITLEQGRMRLSNGTEVEYRIVQSSFEAVALMREVPWCG